MPGRRLIPLFAVAALGAGGALAASAAPPHQTAKQIAVANAPGLVHVTIDFSGAKLSLNEVAASDPSPFDGSAALQVSRAGIETQAADVTAEGVAVHVAQGTDQLTVTLGAVARRFKYVHYALETSHRLVVDLWKSAPPPRAGEITADATGCLTLLHRRSAPGVVRAAGTENGLFEHQFDTVVRGRGGSVVGRRHVTATGAWHVHTPYRVKRAQLGTFEAVALSPKDGSLACLVQVRARLRPRG